MGALHACEPRHFLQPCLLLLLRERPSHGYELVDRLRPFGLADGDSGGVYRALRALERDGLTRSAWRHSESGPARRIYHLTELGLHALEGLTLELRQTRGILDAYLDRYTRADAPAL